MDTRQILANAVYEISELKETIKEMDLVNDSIKQEINYIQTEYSKDIELLNLRIDEIIVSINKG